jgi:hypothetical protein
MVQGKHLYPNKFQFPKIKKFGNLVIGYYLDLGIWLLGFDFMDGGA